MNLSTLSQVRIREAAEDASTDPVVQRLASTMARPTTLARVGLSVRFLGDLLEKHLAAAGVLTTSEIMGRMALAGPIVEQILIFLRTQGCIEVRAKSGYEAELRYGLTEKGRAEAAAALTRSGYVGPTPVPLEDYVTTVTRQSVHATKISQAAVARVFEDFVISEELLDRLGPALNSRRAIFLYGAAGTGKTFTARRLAGALDGLVLVPYAIAVNDAVVEVFDPICHQQVEFLNPPSPAMLEQGFDPRYAACERPIVLTGGELSADMLEVRYDPARRTYTAPIQLKANNGFLLIDDLGRQRVEPIVLFNRWIVPMESQHDSLVLGSGQHFDVPFDVVLVFSTNLSPQDIADDAFLRRLGYKIEFKPLAPDQYRQIWYGVCRDRDLYEDPGLVDFAIHDLHGRDDVPLLACHPRDLIGMAHDRIVYLGRAELDEDAIAWAWSNYFVLPDVAVERHR